MIIYKTTNLINGKIYVGKDSKENEHYIGSGKIFLKAVEKYGKQNFQKEVLEKCQSFEELNIREIFWIKELNATNRNVGYNVSLGGDGYVGIPHTKEHCKKISEALTGKPLSVEHRQKISDKMKGKKRKEMSPEKHEHFIEACRKARRGKKLGSPTEEHRKKISEALKGKIVISEEHRKKISEAQKNRKHEISEETKKKLSEIQTGKKRGQYRKMSEESRQNMGNSRKGKKRGPYKKKLNSEIF